MLNGSSPPPFLLVRFIQGSKPPPPSTGSHLSETWIRFLEGNPTNEERQNPNPRYIEGRGHEILNWRCQLKQSNPNGKPSQLVFYQIQKKTLNLQILVVHSGIRSILSSRHWEVNSQISLQNVISLSTSSPHIPHKRCDASKSYSQCWGPSQDWTSEVPTIKVQ